MNRPDRGPGPGDAPGGPAVRAAGGRADDMAGLKMLALQHKASRLKGRPLGELTGRQLALLVECASVELEYHGRHSNVGFRAGRELVRLNAELACRKAREG